MAELVAAVGVNGAGERVAAGNTRRRQLSTAEPFQPSNKTTPTRVKIEISRALIQSCGIHHDWAKFWFLVPLEVDSVADLLAALWRLLLIDLNPQVKLSCQGFYIPTSSPVEILREGDVVLVQIWSEEATFSDCAVATTVEAVEPTQPLPKNALVTLQPHQQPSAAQPSQSGKIARTGPSRNARRKKLKRRLRREGVLPPKTPKSIQSPSVAAHSRPKTAPANGAAPSSVAKNGTLGTRKLAQKRQSHGQTDTNSNTPAAAAAAGASTSKGAIGEEAPTGNNTSPLNNSRKRSRNDAAAVHVHAPAEGGADVQKQVKRAEDWANFLNRTGTGSGKLDTAQQQPVRETSSSEEESSADEDNIGKHFRQVAVKNESGKTVLCTKQPGPVGMHGKHVYVEQHVQQNQQEEESEESDSSEDESDSEEAEESSGDEESSEESSSSEEDEDATEEGDKEATAAAMKVGNNNKSQQHAVGVVGTKQEALGMGRGRDGLREGVYEGVHTHGIGKKLIFEDPCEQAEDAYELEPPDSSGRFASAVEPWLAAHSQKQPDHSGKKPMKGGDAVNGGHGRARAYTHGAKGAGASAAATAAAVEYVATEKVSEHSKSTEGAATEPTHTEEELGRLALTTEKKEELVTGPGSLPSQVAEGCVLMYKVAELNPACMPWVSGWRFGTVRSTSATSCTSHTGDPAGTELQISPWPDETVHPLERAWVALGESSDASQAMSRGKGRGRDLDSDEACAAWIQDSMHYDPVTGWFSGLWAMDIVNAKLVLACASSSPVASSPTAATASEAINTRDMTDGKSNTKLATHTQLPPPPPLQPSTAATPNSPIPQTRAAAAAAAAASTAGEAGTSAATLPAAATKTSAATATAMAAEANDVAEGRDVTEMIQKEASHASEGNDAGEPSKGVPVAVVHPEAEAALAEALSLLEDHPAKQHKHNNRKKHDGKKAGNAASHASQTHNKASIPSPIAGSLLPETPVAIAAAATPQTGSAAPTGSGEGAPAAATWPLANTTSPHKSPQALLQVLQQLEARKAELMKSSKAAEGAVLEGGAQVDAGAGGGSQECGENGKAEQKQVQQHADKRKRCHSADGAKLEDAVGRTKARGTRQAHGGRRQSAIAPTLALLRQSSGGPAE